MNILDNTVIISNDAGIYETISLLSALNIELDIDNINGYKCNIYKALTRHSYTISGGRIDINSERSCIIVYPDMIMNDSSASEIAGVSHLKSDVMVYDRENIIPYYKLVGPDGDTKYIGLHTSRDITKKFPDYNSIRDYYYNNLDSIRGVRESDLADMVYNDIDGIMLLYVSGYFLISTLTRWAR